MTRAKTLYQKLLDSGVIGSEGRITFSMQGLDVPITDVSVVGNIIQEWLETFMCNNHVKFRKKSNIQAFPDFLLNPESDTVDLLEVKTFTNSPNFDVANFNAYARSLRKAAFRLDAAYLILEYTPKGTGIIINNIWLKNIWEICSASERSAVKIQWKQSSPVNIRPAIWYSDRTKYPAFQTMREFVVALKKVIDTAGVSTDIQQGWLAAVEDNYRNYTNNEL